MFGADSWLLFCIRRLLEKLLAYPEVQRPGAMPPRQAPRPALQALPGNVLAEAHRQQDDPDVPDRSAGHTFKTHPSRSDPLFPTLPVLDHPDVINQTHATTAWMAEAVDGSAQSPPTDVLLPQHLPVLPRLQYQPERTPRGEPVQAITGDGPDQQLWKEKHPGQVPGASMEQELGSASSSQASSAASSSQTRRDLHPLVSTLASVPPSISVPMCW